MRLILITNDDGIHSDGIKRLAQGAKEFGEVWVVAPDSERSAASQSITLRTHIDVYPAEIGVAGVKAFSCSGTPGDCVRLGTLNVLPRRPDTVLSGINNGFNMATDIQYSATVGAAFEAAFQGCRAIALSEETGKDHRVTDLWLGKVLRRLIDAPAEEGQIFNVNFPSCDPSEIKGILEERCVSRRVVYEDRYNELLQLEGGGIRYMVEGTLQKEAEEGTDFHAILNGYISIGRVSNVC